MDGDGDVRGEPRSIPNAPGTDDRSLTAFLTAERHFLHGQTVYWSRLIVMMVLQGALIATFVLRFSSGSGINALAVTFALFGLATSVLTVVLSLSAVQGILLWRAAFLSTAAEVGGLQILEEVETTHRITNPTQSSVLLPVAASIAWAALLLAYTL